MITQASCFLFGRLSTRRYSALHFETQVMGCKLFTILLIKYASVQRIGFRNSSDGMQIIHDPTYGISVEIRIY